ncbi:hypothetical protein FD00_GL001252 [Liquorilactobacillus mali KCTC 3596 = DSM 20444]|uniref:Uncharacterized protein n=1 Tax=Liquorilactobacillus mali KCTC 3596 = DSM 20444 TaxID=1046596 RepID=A0A0R2E488_9LACO|nr:hypothetical protein FD00_GL001252 [Liquorilactobacillus mali KCTC 3596 = DSM 20444]
MKLVTGSLLAASFLFAFKFVIFKYLNSFSIANFINLGRAVNLVQYGNALSLIVNKFQYKIRVYQK